MKTDLNYIKKLIKLLESGDVNEIEIDEEGTKIRLVKNRQSENASPHYISYPQPQMHNTQTSSAAPDTTSQKAEEKSDQIIHSAREQADQAMAEANAQAKEILTKAEATADSQAERRPHCGFC